MATRYTFFDGSGPRLKETFGPLPGKRYEFYVKQSGFANKWMLWLAEDKKWHHLREGDVIEYGDDDILRVVSMAHRG